MTDSTSTSPSDRIRQAHIHLVDAFRPDADADTATLAAQQKRRAEVNEFVLASLIGALMHEVGGGRDVTADRLAQIVANECGRGIDAGYDALPEGRAAAGYAALVAAQDGENGSI